MTASVRLLCVTLLAMAAAGCAHQPAQTDIAEPAVRIDVEERATDRWRVSWELPEPVDRIAFLRSREPFRYELWRIVEPAGARWSRSGNRDVLELRAPARRIVIELDSDFRTRVKDYEINLPFTDGGRLFYTGHFRIGKVRSCAECEDGVEIVGLPPEQWTLRTRPDRMIRVPGAGARGVLRWVPRSLRSREDGTYVYFGNVEPVETDRATIILDPGLPGWLRERSESAFPAAFDDFASLTGFELGFRPLVTLSFQPGEQSGLSFSGGTLEGFVQISAVGNGWLKPSRDGEIHWTRYVAHELFHLWDGQRFVADEQSEWLSEAMAEYAGLLSSHESGLIDERAFDAAVIRQANDCIVSSGTGGMATAAARGDFESAYDCGNVLMRMIDGRASPEGRSVAMVWRRLFTRAEARKDRTYSTDDFLEVVAGTLDPATSSRVHRLVMEGPAPRADHFVFNALIGAGLHVKLVEPSRATADPSTHRTLARKILSRCACRTGKPAVCDDASRIERIADHDLRRTPAEAVRVLMTAIDREQPVELRVRDGGTVELSCTREDLEPDWKSLLASHPR